jgi:NAD-dependent DNA ligase
MAATPQRSSPVALIIFIVLFVFATMGLVFVSIELDKARTQLNQGWQAKQNLPGASAIDTKPGLKLALYEAEQELTEEQLKLKEFADVVGKPTAEALREELDALKPEIREIQKGQSVTLIGYITILQSRLQEAKQRFEAQLRAAEEQRKEVEKRLEAAEATVSEKDKALEKLRQDFKEIETRYAGNLSKARDEASKLRDQLRKERAQFEARQSANEEQIARLDRFINDLQRRLKETGTLKFEGKGWDPDDETPDGRVLLVDRNAGVMINIGRKKGVRRGLRFHVYDVKADGTRVKRGKLEVKTVYPEISRCKLLDSGADPTTVLHKDDIIINAAFDPGRARVFVADTVFDEAAKQGFREALARHGSVLEDDVTVRTNYLIVGATPGKHYQVAEKLGVPLIRESDLNEFLGR